jgi:hypothetical protein
MEPDAQHYAYGSVDHHFIALVLLYVCPWVRWAGATKRGPHRGVTALNHPTGRALHTGQINRPNPGHPARHKQSLLDFLSATTCHRVTIITARGADAAR